MLKAILFLMCIWSAHSYFTLPGKCPTMPAMGNFNINDFYGKWYQSYFYSSDGQKNNNCSVVELSFNPGHFLGKVPMFAFNQSRVARGLFHRYSMGRISPPPTGATLDLNFDFVNAPRRMAIRKYQFHVLATNYNYYATAYTCQYSPLIDKHFIYVWLLSRRPILNDVSKELAVKPLRQLGVDPGNLVKDDLSKCNPKYYEDVAVEPTTFRFPVPI